MARRHHHIKKDSNLLFYVPFTQDKLPVYAWDNNLTIRADTGGIISDNALLKTATNQYIVYDSFPTDSVYNDLTISIRQKPVLSSGVNHYWGVGIQGGPFGGFCFGVPYRQNSWQLIGIQGRQIYNFNKTTTGEVFDRQHFYSVRLRYNDGFFQATLFRDGVLLEDSGLYKVPSNIYSIGDTNLYRVGTIENISNMLGTYQHLSIHHNMTDQQIIKLHQRGGVPETE